MKLAILNSASINTEFGETSTDDRHYKERCYYLVSDSYNFVINNATEITGAEATEWIDRLVGYGRVEVEEQAVEDSTLQYLERSNNRNKQMHKATMFMVGYFMSLGDDQSTAEYKVGQISDESASELYQYVVGRTQPLIDKINASTLVFMDASAKAYLISKL